MTPNAAQNNNVWKTATLGLGVALVVVLLIVAWGMFGSDSDQKAEPSTSTTKASPSTSSAPPTTDTASADGCLGGEDPQTAVLAAQREAPLTAKGAAEFAASLDRWAGYSPRSDGAQDQKILKKVAAGPALKKYQKLGYITRDPPAGTIRAWSTTTRAHYRIVSVSPKKVVLDLWTRQNVQMESLDTKHNVTGGRYEIRTNDQGHWVRWSESSPGDWKDVVRSDYKGAQRFVGGC